MLVSVSYIILWSTYGRLGAEVPQEGSILLATAFFCIVVLEAVARKVLMFGQGVILHPGFLFSNPINIMTMFSLSVSLTKSRYITLILSKYVFGSFNKTVSL